MALHKQTNSDLRGWAREARLRVFSRIAIEWLLVLLALLAMLLAIHALWLHPVGWA